MIKDLSIAIVAINKRGKKIALRIMRSLPDSRLYIPGKGRLADLTGRLFSESDGIIFCMAMGIVTRVISPYLKDKHIDPAVVVVDDAGRYSISVLSGHEGGANNLAVTVSNILGAEPVITTASEVKKDIVIGVGCRRGVEKEEVTEAIRQGLMKIRCPINDVRAIATIDLKENESGLRKACSELGISLRVVSSELVKNFNGVYRRSSFVKGKIGVEGVSEPCALLTARKPRLILEKTKFGKVTVAIAKEG